MYKIEWKRFEIINENYTKAFETLCHHVFCRECKVTGYVPANFNQKGLETKPVKYKGRYYGYQAKYFEDGMDYKQIKNSVLKALNEFKDTLDFIYIYYNCNAVISNSKTAKEIEQAAKKQKVKIIWFGEKSFETLLNQPYNFDLTQLFFGVSDEFGFINDNINPKILTLINSEEYIDLPLTKEGSGTKLSLDTLVKESFNNKDICFITGNPGAGKSICMNKLFQVCSGLDKLTSKERVEVITNNKAIPMIINLKNCSQTSLEDIIRTRQNKYNLQNGDLGFIYILDGLDELSLEQADVLLNYVYELANKGTTKKIILSSRKLSPNKTLVKKYFRNLDEYRIDSLGISHIKRFFDAKNNDTKNTKLNELLESNNVLINDIEDVLLIRLLWDIIEHVGTNISIIDIIASKIDLILEDVSLKKDLNRLNIPNPKKSEIIELNKIIALEMHTCATLAYPLVKLNELIAKRYPCLNYNEINNIAAYLCQTFFDNADKINIENSFTYQHRRYQEYFLAMNLRDMYEKNPSILREQNILANKDYFENFLMKYLRNYYENRNDLVGIIEINLMDVYLGHNRSWGADRPWYEYSNSLALAVASQEEQQSNILLQDVSLPIGENIAITTEKIRRNLASKKSRIQSIPDDTEEMIKYLLRNIVVFWKNGKFEISKYLLNELIEIQKLFIEEFKEYKKHFFKAIDDEYESHLYILIVILNRDLSDILNNILRNIGDRERKYRFQESEAEKANKSFFRICLNSKLDELFSFFNSLNDDEFVDLLNTICEAPFIHLLNNKRLKKLIISRINALPVSYNKHLSIIAYKKFYSMPVAEDEIELLKTDLISIQKERWIDIFGMYNNYYWFSFLSYVLQKEKLHYGNYDSRYLYQQLFSDYIDLTKGKVNITHLVKRFCDLSKNFMANKYNNISWYVSNLLSIIFSYSEIDNDKVLPSLRYLVNNSSKFIGIMALLKGMKLNCKTNVDNCIKEFLPLIEKLYENGHYQEQEYATDISDIIDSYFIIAYLCSSFDPSTSFKYIVQAINSSVLRHGWRKDYIVDSSLVNALEIMLNNSLIDKSTLVQKTNKIIDMILYLNKITDESYRCESFERIVSFVSKHDMALCTEIMNNLKGRSLITNEMLLRYLLSKVVNGEDLKDIFLWMQSFERTYGYQDKLSPECFLCKIEIYLSILEMGWYANDVKLVVKKLLEQIEILKSNNLTEIADENLYHMYLKFCKKYRIKCELIYKKFEYKSEHKTNSEINTKNFISKLGKVRSRKALFGLYEELKDYKLYITLSERDIWMLLLNRTFEITNDISLFCEYLHKNLYPHMSSYGSNSKYLHYGVAYALERLDFKQEMIYYLSKNSGHDGFINILRSFEVNKDKERCIKLFNRFFEFCEFIVFG